MATSGITTDIGRLNEFQRGKDNFDCYMDRMEQYFIENSIVEEKQVAVFLTAIGGPTYELLRNLVSPDAPKDKSLEQLKTAFCTHLKPKPLTIAEHFKFHKRMQRKGKSVDEYVVALKELTIHCEFGGFLNEALRDCLVCALFRGRHRKDYSGTSLKGHSE